MRKKVSFRSVLSVVLLLSLLLSLSACSRSERGGSTRGGGRGETRESVKLDEKPDKNDKKEEKTQEKAASTPSLAMTPEVFGADPALAVHKADNAALYTASASARKADAVQLYFENTTSLQRFFNSKLVNAFSLGVRNVYSAVNRYFDNSQLSCYALDTVEGRTRWVRLASDDNTRSNTQTKAFYAFENGSTNYLGLLFDDHTVTFGKDSLNVVISSFTEPAFDLSGFGQGLDRYMADNPGSAVCLYGALSSVEAHDLQVYRFDKAANEPDFTILDFSGSLPFYILAAGPEESVRAFDTAMDELMRSSSVTFRRSVFSNGVYTQLQAPPLALALVADPKLKSGSGEILQSYNTGTLTEDPDGNIYCATYAGIETKDDRNSSANLSYSSRIACVSKNLDTADGPFYSADFTLYAYDAESQSWQPCDKLASSRVELICRPLQGSSPEGSAILAAGDEQLYISAKLDFSADSPLDRSTMYRVEVRLKLNYENPDPVSEGNVGSIRDLCISDMDYYRALNDLRVSSGFHKSYIKAWEYSSGEKKESAKAALMRTPNLESLLSTLEKAEHYVPETADRIEYIDFIYNLKDTNSR